MTSKGFVTKGWIFFGSRGVERTLKTSLISEKVPASIACRVGPV